MLVALILACEIGFWVVLGSGLGPLAGEVKDAIRIAYGDLPGFPRSGVSGHPGEIVAGDFAGRPVLLLAGRAHYYEHGDASVMRAALEALAGIGVTRLILTNAAGSLREDTDPTMVDRLWNPFVAAWYTGKDDPKLCLLRLDAEHAEVWLDASSLLAGVKMLFGLDPKKDYQDKVREIDLGSRPH